MLFGKCCRLGWFFIAEDLSFNGLHANIWIVCGMLLGEITSPTFQLIWFALRSCRANFSFSNVTNKIANQAHKYGSLTAAEALKELPAAPAILFFFSLDMVDKFCTSAIYIIIVSERFFCIFLENVYFFKKSFESKTIWTVWQYQKSNGFALNRMQFKCNTILLGLIEYTHAENSYGNCNPALAL